MLTNTTTQTMLLLASRLRTGPGLLAAAALLVSSSADAAATAPLEDVDPKPIEVSGTLDAAGLADLRVRLAVRPRRPPQTVGADDWLSGPTVRWSAPAQVESAGRFTVAQPWPRDRHASPRAVVGTVDAGEALCALTQHATAVTVPAPPADAGGGVQTLETGPPDPQAVHVDSTHLRIPQSRVVRGLPPGEYWVVQRRPLADGGTQLGWWTSFEVEAPAR